MNLPNFYVFSSVKLNKFKLMNQINLLITDKVTRNFQLVHIRFDRGKIITKNEHNEINSGE